MLVFHGVAEDVKIQRVYLLFILLLGIRLVEDMKFFIPESPGSEAVLTANQIIAEGEAAAILTALTAPAAVEFVAVETVVTELHILAERTVISVLAFVRLAQVLAVLAFGHDRTEVAVFVVIGLLAVVAVVRIHIEKSNSRDF